MTTNDIDRSKEGVIASWFDYSPETGSIFWKRWVSPSWYERQLYYRRFMQNKAGNPVCFRKTKQGHLYVYAGGNQGIYAHQIAWFLTYGEMPEYCIDHIDGNPENNAIENLRDVPRKINCRNKKISSLNTSGATGVYWHPARKKWRARVGIDGGSQSLGCYETVEDAAEARKNFLKENSDLGYTSRHGQKES